MYGRIALWLMVVCVACGAPSKQTSTMTPQETPQQTGDTQAVGIAADGQSAAHGGPFGGPPGLDFALRAGRYTEPAPERVRNVAGTPVGDPEVDALLKGLSPLPKDASLDTSFAKRAGSAPPPTAVVELKDVFGAKPGS